MNQLPETAFGTLRLFATTQTQIDVFSDQLIQAVKEGEANPLEVYTFIKAFEKMADRVQKEIKENLLTEADKYPEKTFELMGNKFEKAEVGTKYDYTVCNDPVYNGRLQIFNKASEQVKEREAFLKALKQPITIVDEGTGEIVTISPPLKTSQSGIKLTIR